MMLTACGTTPTPVPDAALVPRAVIPTAAERDVLRVQIPDFYVRFTDQQVKILKARGELPADWRP
jgi:hypothetical protein